MSAASENLKSNQRQLDMDGVEVGVSRQAVDETLDQYGAMLATLKDIAAGNVPPGFLNGIELESKASFQERLSCWMQSRAHAAIALTEDREPVTPTEGRTP